MLQINRNKFCIESVWSLFGWILSRWDANKWAEIIIKFFKNISNNPMDF